MTAGARRGLAPGLLVGAAVVAARVAEVGGKLGSSTLIGAPTLPGEVQRWLGWQLWDNIRAGRSPLDASVFPSVSGSLLDVVGNPGVAALLAPFHALGSVNFAHSLGMFALLFTACLAGGVYGGVRGVPWIGALAAGAAWWQAGLAGGLAAQAWLAPGLAAATAYVLEKRGWAAAFAALGAVTAPLATAAVLAGAAAWPLAGLAALGCLVAPFGEANALTPADLLWVAGGAHRAVPLAAWFALAFLWGERGRERAVSVGVGLCLLAAVSPMPVAGFRISEAMWGGWAGGSSVALAMLLSAALGPAARRLTQHGRIAVALLCFADSLGPAFLGGGAWWGAPAPAPAALVAAGGEPRSRVVTVLPESANPAAGVGWIPVHRQLASRPPELEIGAGGLDTRPQEVATRLRSATTPTVLVVANTDPSGVSAFASALGAPDALGPDVAVWTWP
ncbi:hypothetical protein LBMAG42_30570 [Deltaproteobacteria bacterium]|nr:hypothetical protein LBMAG42_30570 [Deltaproteobacteria bacterium]